MKIALGADHAGFEFKEILKKYLQTNGHEVQDFGAHSTDSVDYPDFAHPTAEYIAKGEAELGFLLCGSGNGVAMAANKHAGVRAAIAWMPELAILARTHNDANILVIPSRFVSEHLMMQMVEEFLKNPFEGGRHARRVQKIKCG